MDVPGTRCIRSICFQGQRPAWAAPHRRRSKRCCRRPPRSQTKTGGRTVAGRIATMIPRPGSPIDRFQPTPEPYAQTTALNWDDSKGLDEPFCPVPCGAASDWQRIWRVVALAELCTFPAAHRANGTTPIVKPAGEPRQLLAQTNWNTTIIVDQPYNQFSFFSPPTSSIQAQNPVGRVSMKFSDGSNSQVNQ